MPERLKLDASINTTFEKIIDFAQMLCEKWSPAFYLSITRDGKKGFSIGRFREWLEDNKSHVNWNNLYPDNTCNARLQSGKNKGMRCSKKQLLFSELKVNDKGESIESISSNGFCGVHKNVRDKWNSKGYMDEVTREKLLYSGEPPTSKQSLKTQRILKAKVKLPQRSFTDEEPTEEDFMKSFTKMANNINKLIDKTYAHDNVLKKLTKTIESLKTPEQKLNSKTQENQEEISLAVKCGFYDDGDVNHVMDEGEYQMGLLKSTPKWEDLATPEQIEKKQEKEIKKQEKFTEKINRFSEEDIKANIFESKLRCEMEYDGDIPELTDIEKGGSYMITEGIQGYRMYGIRTNEENTYDVENVGLNLEKQTNIINDVESTTIRQREYILADKKFEDENRKLWKNKKPFIAFMDPSIDPLQDHLINVVVKIMKEYDENVSLTWLEYYSKLQKRIRVFNKIMDDDRVSDLFRQQIQGVALVVIRKMENVMNEYGVRPKTKVSLIQAMQEIDFASRGIKQVILEYQLEELDKINEREENREFN